MDFDISKCQDETLFVNVFSELKKLFIKQISHKNSLEINLNILNSLNRQLTLEKHKLQKQKIIVDKNTKCCICERPIGMTVPQVFNGKIAHLYHDIPPFEHQLKFYKFSIISDQS